MEEVVAIFVVATGIACVVSAVFVFRNRKNKDSTGFRRSLILLALSLVLFGGSALSLIAANLTLTN